MDKYEFMDLNDVERISKSSIPIMSRYSSIRFHLKKGRQYFRLKYFPFAGSLGTSVVGISGFIFEGGDAAMNAFYDECSRELESIKSNVSAATRHH
jgi:hypothetical protein